MKNLLLLISVLFICNLNAQIIEEREYVKVSTEFVKVVESNRQKVVGIDVSKLFNRIIKNYDRYKLGGRGIGPSGVLWTLREIEDPNNPEIKLGKRNLNTVPVLGDREGKKLKPFFNITIGVLRTHESALLMTERHLSHISIIPILDLLDVDDPGFVSWTIPLSTGKVFVRDNVFVSLQMSDNFDQEKIMEQLNQELINGSDGVLKGNTVFVPRIESNTIPDSIAFEHSAKGTIALSARDVDDLKLYRNIWVSAGNSEPDQFRFESNRSDPPVFRWESEGQVEITSNGPVDEIFEVTAVVVNELCVVSDVMVKQIKVTIP